MIRVDRKRVSSPLENSEVEMAKRRLHEYYQIEEIERRQRKPPVDDTLFDLRFKTKNALMELFNAKCAYCESPISTANSSDVEGPDFEIDRFRPLSGASNLDGRGSLDHYGWLALDWENMYAACKTCGRAKRSLFPVDGPRAMPLTPVEVINDFERALLIDPCRDFPERHLEFREDGSIQARDMKGEITIKTLNLNRAQLREARRAVCIDVKRMRDRGERYFERGDPEQLYSAAARSVIERGPKDLASSHSREVPEEHRTAAAVIETDEEAFRLTARPLQSISIRNFKVLGEIDLTFPEPRNDKAPWLVLLGENGSGKSSLLQAVALALAGADEATRLTRPSKVLSHGSVRGQITLKFWDSSSPVELLFSRGSAQFEGTRRPSAIVLGYGALRYPEMRPRRKMPIDEPRFARIAPLLRPVASIPDPGHWLANLDEVHFDVAARALKDILPLQDDAVLVRKDARIKFRVGTHVNSLSQMSAGYQAIVGMCADIMQLLFERWQTLSSATAIVLIDEIDAHLHPRWKMRIVDALRGAFPQVQFIASTHDPLVLRGLMNGEVALMGKNGEGIVTADRNLPAIEGMLVDELLTSRHFGLNSTVDPATEALRNEYYYLLSLPAESGNEDRITELRSRIGDRESLGRNRRENLMLDAARSFLDETTNDDPPRQETLKAATVARLRTLIQRTGAPIRTGEEK